MNYTDYGIEIPNGRVSGEVQMLCPKCSHTRKKKHIKCLSVNLDKKVWHCNHCDWSGGIVEKFEQIKYEVPEWKNNTDLTDKVLKWFENRRISAETCLKLKITSETEFMPQVNDKVSVIAFNYFFEDSIINVKYRDSKKNFKLYKGAELIPYNINSVIGANEVWIVEGEMDVCALVECGIDQVVSVPNGASNNLQYFDKFMPMFDSVDRIHLAVDNDPKGRELRNALADRFGRDKCDYVVFGEYKDANDYLRSEGKIALKEAAKNFTEFPLEGVFTISDIIDDIEDMYLNGLPNGEATGMPGFDSLLRFQKGYLTTITGIPGHGKSDFLDHVLLKLHKNAGWKGGFYSPENRPTQLHFSKLARKISQKAWFGHNRLSREELLEAMYVLDQKFWFIKPESEFTLDSILKHVAELKNRKDIDFFVIDAWNKLEHLYTESETKYIGQSLDKLVAFCERYNVHCFLVAHPTKIRKDKETELYDIPNLYDIAGSANFFNKTDNGITVYRNMKTDVVEVHIQKVKFSHWGQLGMQKFVYDKTTGLYLESL